MPKMKYHTELGGERKEKQKGLTTPSLYGGVRHEGFGKEMGPWLVKKELKMSKRCTSTQPSPSVKEQGTTTLSVCSLPSPRSELGAMLEFLQRRSAARASHETAWQRRRAEARASATVKVFYKMPSLYLPRAARYTVAIVGQRNCTHWTEQRAR